MAKKIERKSGTVPATRTPASSGPPTGPGDWVWMHLHGEWRDVTGKPEERVRQEFILHLHNDYGYLFEQMDQERRTMHGRRSPRADIVIWESPEAKTGSRTPVLVVECKAEKVDIDIRDYYQGESYTRAVGCEFFIAHNARHRRMLDAAGTNILDLFEIGKDKANRATEIIFVERCLSLLKPGGRMGIVLPDGNLNNPSLSWLRRWCEGKARVLAVVSLPEETFRSADATVKASLVFFRRFTADDEVAWEAAWAEAHLRHDDAFNARRDALCSEFGRRIVTGESARIEKIVDELALLGVERTAPAWRAGLPPDYPRGIGPTRLANPRWNGTASDRQRAARLKRDYAVAFDDDENAKRRADALLRELRAGLRALDETHSAALWATVREMFDYPVFVAAPSAVGITSTGETGENVPDDFPQLLDAWHAFQAWVEAGAKPEDAPDFPLPSAA